MAHWLRIWIVIQNKISGIVYYQVVVMRRERRQIGLCSSILSVAVFPRSQGDKSEFTSLALFRTKYLVLCCDHPPPSLPLSMNGHRILWGNSGSPRHLFPPIWELFSRNNPTWVAVSIFSPQVLVFLSLSSNRLFSIAYFVSYLICCLAQVQQIYPINQVKLV